MTEKWIRWIPNNEISLKYYIESITDNIEGLRIRLSNANNESDRIEVVFENSVHAYRSTDESYMQNVINKLDEQYGSKFYQENTFFKVENSEYIHWLSLQSYGIAKSEPLEHFSFLGVDSVIDVIAAYEPEINKLIP
ncbi:hypothetical protein [Cohnella thermotolerans]|uniref:hypothetical protein n=1 Tax=Cohnella thermotolerans TaxID=329858 RepID=UPI00047995C1|nr:hypothetical protein [Cohnella thermotolerans]